MSLSQLKPFDQAMAEADRSATGGETPTYDSEEVKEMKEIQAILDRGPNAQMRNSLGATPSPTTNVIESIFQTTPKGSDMTSFVSIKEASTSKASKKLFPVREEDSSLFGKQESVTKDPTFCLFVTPFHETKDQSNAICGFRYKRGDYFCITKGCLKAAHIKSKEKVELKPGFGFIKKDDQKAFVNPSISVNSFPAEERMALTFSQKTWDEWNDDFFVSREIEAAPESEKVDYRVKKEFVKAAREFKTPSKVSIAPALKVEEPGATYYDIRKESIDESDPLMENDPALVFVDKALKQNADQHISFESRLTAHENLILQVGKSFDTKMNDLRVELGRKSTMPQMGPDVWTSVNTLADEAATLLSSFHTLKNDFAILQSDYRNFARSVPDDEIRMLKGGLTRANKRANENQGVISEILKRHEASIHELTFSCNENTKSIGTQGPSVDVHRIDERIGAMETAVARLKADTDKEAIQFHNLGFTCREEADAWIEENDMAGHFGLVVDVFIACEHMYQYIHGIDSLPRFDKINKLKIRNNCEALCVNSFEHSVPKLLTAPNGHLVYDSTTSLLSKIKTYKDWNNPTSGFKLMLTKKIEEFSRNQRATIKAALPAGHAMLDLALASVSFVSSWLYNNIRFMDDTFNGYAAGKFGDAKAWHVTSKLETAIFLELAKERDSTINNFSPGEQNVLNNAKLIFWVTLKTLDKMAEISAANFEDHPCVNTELVKFLSLNTSVEAVDKLVTVTTDHSSRLDSLARELAAADRSSKTAANMATDNKRLLKELENRIKKLENKK